MAERSWKPRSRLASSADRPSARSGCPASSAVLQRRRMSRSLPSSGVLPFLRSRSSRSRRRSTTPRSARMTSSSIVRTSRAGSIVPVGCGTDGSRNIRTTCSSASALRNGARSSSACAPVCAPPVPATSANSTVAGTCLRGLKSALRRSRPLVGHARDADVRFRLAARARRLARARQQLKERRLARRRESKETCSEHVKGSPARGTDAQAESGTVGCSSR